MEFGCRGVIHLGKIEILEHEFDPPRFDLLLSDGTSWYFRFSILIFHIQFHIYERLIFNRYSRAESVEEKNNWLELIEDAKADAIEGRMKGRAGSIPSVGEFFFGLTSRRYDVIWQNLKIDPE